ncbi:MAG TPA: hypothetical protein VFM14_11430 [Gemmatimonadales bacterium]|nr:hypothetical protein [Gemmatimonadales bacterium]
MFDGLRDRLDRLFVNQGGAGARSAAAAALRDATREAEQLLTRLRDALAETEQAVRVERQRLDDAERRGRLAAAVPDAETVAIAARFAARHRERLVLLERKVAVQRDELQMGERELEELAAHAAELGRRDLAEDLRSAARTGEHPSPGAGRSFEDDLKRMQAERRLMDEAVERQLDYLKKKMGKDSV